MVFIPLHPNALLIGSESILPSRVLGKTNNHWNGKSITTDVHSVYAARVRTNPCCLSMPLGYGQHRVNELADAPGGAGKRNEAIYFNSQICTLSVM